MMGGRRLTIIFGIRPNGGSHWVHTVMVAEVFRELGRCQPMRRGGYFD